MRNGRTRSGLGGPWATSEGAAGVVGVFGSARGPRGRWQRARARSVDHVTRALAHAAAAGLVDASALSGHVVRPPVGVFCWSMDDDATNDAIGEFQCKEAVWHETRLRCKLQQIPLAVLIVSSGQRKRKYKKMIIFRIMKEEI